MTKLIIGKNSSLAKKLRENLKEFHFISHLDIDNININFYSEVYIFSYSKDSVEENINLLNKIYHGNLFYLSTVAVFSLGYSGEFYKYPKIKSEMEEYCLQRGIKVIRIGSFANAQYFKKTVAVTTNEMLIDYFGDPKKSDLKNLFYIDPYKENFLGYLYEKIFNLVIHRKSLTLLLAIISKLFNKKLYGYSYAANSCLKEHIQIGYGALGSRLKQNDTTHIVVSNDKNLKLTENGFNGLLIGKTLQGLGTLWHGVYTMFGKDDKRFVEKRIIRKNKIFKSEKSRLNIFPVRYIENDGDYWTLTSKNDSNKKLITRGLTIAAGPIENLRLLSCLEKININLNDDEVLFAGTINLNEPYLANFLKIDELTVRQKNLFHCEIQGGYLLVDFRPYISNKNNKLDQNFYNNSFIQIIYKLITKFNIYRINEAIFNMYGFGIKTKKISIYCQYSKTNSINICADQGNILSLSKERATCNELNEINTLLLNLFDSFENAGSNIETVDGQHISGGEEVLLKKNIMYHIKKSTLKIIGIPSKKFNDALHTTVRLFPDEL